VLILLDSPHAREIGIELTKRLWRPAHIAALLSLAEAARDRSASSMRIGKIGAAIP
jgi:hypothetical protein